MRSGIADYSAELLPYLIQEAQVTLFADFPDHALDPGIAENPSPVATHTLPLRPQPISSYDRWRFDLALYHMGNSEFHRDIYRMLLRYTGVVVLHDVFIHQFLAHTTVGHGNYGAYAGELGLARGREGIHLANEIRSGRQPHPLFEIPLTDRLVRSSLGLIVHSRFAAALLQEQRPRCPLALIPAPIAAHDGRSRRQELNLPGETVIFAAMGQVTHNRQVELLLPLFKQLYEERRHVFLLFAGEVLPEVDLPRMLEELELTGATAIVGHVPGLAAFVDWIHTADVLINLRFPTAGETSATALRGLAAGRPLIVTDHGWYRELPDTAVLKVPPMDEAALLHALRVLATSAEKRREMGDAAARYARQTHDPGQVAQQYIRFLRRLREKWTLPEQGVPKQGVPKQGTS
jgi:glycosyltransferase involved in cell wall biosynthesis